MSPELMEEYAALWRRMTPMREMSRKLGYSPQYLMGVARKNRSMFPKRAVHMDRGGRAR